MLRKHFLTLQSFSKRIHEDSLYKNSIYLIASQIALAGLGFVFWIINARLFSVAQIGIATTLISVTGSISSFAMLGFNMAMIRYLPTEDNKRLFVNNAYAVVGLASAAIAIIFLIFLPSFSPPLVTVLDNGLFRFFFILFMAVATINAITDNVFIALRSTEYIFVVGIVVGMTKILSSLLLIKMKENAVFYSYSVGVTIGMILSIFFLLKFKLNFSPKFHKPSILKVWKFALGNYSASLIGMLNASIMPILITNSLGPKTTAYYYMPTMIISLVQSLPRSMSSSLFAEGSRDNGDLRSLFFKSLKATYILLIPMVAGLFFFGQYVLLVFGKSYSFEGIVYLRYVLLSLLIVVPNYLVGSILYIQKRIRLQILVSCCSLVVGLSLTVLFLPFGLAGLGISSILGQSIMLLISLIAVASKLN